MFERVDWGTRLRMTEAPQELVKPTCKVVKIAMKKFEMGSSLDDLDMQHLVLKSPETNRIYRLTRVRLNITRDQSGAVAKIEPRDASSGLFIEGFEVTKDGRLDQVVPEFQAPQSLEYVTRENLYLLRGILPSSMENLAEDLLVAEPVSISGVDIDRWNRRRVTSF